MPVLPVTTFGADILQPWQDPDLARTIAVNLEAGTYAKGTLLGEVVNATSQNEQQTLTPSGGADTPTGGTFVLTLDGVATSALAFNSTAAQIVAALTAAFGVAICTATGGPINTTPVVLTFINDYAARDVPMVTVTNNLTGGTPTLTPSETAKGRAASGTYKTYATGNTDGSGVAKAILQYACTVNGSGKISVNSEHGFTYKTISAFVRGVFRTTDIIGLDSDALADLGANFRSGSLAAGGVIQFG
jgi:hypothetical protein